ncbi:receptor-type adenylate cyclase GRESAG 4, putative [Trypanosoma brucei brucei TREU927]|uniref:adenylate cyclase n=1 Tax=Trypanosoma brucei brucei (strain 927/4 GUTat10.1) TaxID=185431 RepID=Q57VY1_TRYB2|nr:receptor-type adenylate cyclase GRESAG 4, putative [Trypanosoma brucei brucei TREU927]AAX70262.1 receptor-type adenylate cyclase GRESAG 4, putative [Trypanosoma brucei]AAZ11147.1 receptor-type adenylate cyclase GRESAG 4, putative [Trypanosoma brucei brucei TREU927]
MTSLLSKLSLPLLQLLFLLLSFSTTGRAEDNITINVLSLMYSPDVQEVEVDSLNAGFEASLTARGWKTNSKARVSFIRPPSYDTPVAEFFESVVKESEGKLMIVFGPFGGPNTMWVKGELSKHGAVSFGPLAFSTEVREWDPHLYFISVEPNAELLALFRYAVVFLGLPRVGITYLKGTPSGEALYEFALDISSMMGHELCGAFAAAGGVGADEDALAAEWNQFVETRPQAVLLFAPVRNPATEWFIGRIVKDERARQMYVLAPSTSQGPLIRTWRDALYASNVSLNDGQLIITGTIPPSNLLTLASVRRFREEMDNHLKSNSEWGGFSKPPHFSTDEAISDLMMTGWLTGEILSQALHSTDVLTDRTAFMDSLYRQRRYVVDDLVVGDYGNECGEFASMQGAMCNCNQGGSAVYMKEVVDGFRMYPVINGFLMWGVSQCSSANVKVYAPLYGVFILIVDSYITERSARRWYEGASSVPADGSFENDRLFFHPFRRKLSEVAGDLAQLVDNRIVSAVFGGVTRDALRLPNVTFINPLAASPIVGKFRRNVLLLSPTVRQQLYVIAMHLSNASTGAVSAAIRSKRAEVIGDVLNKSLMTFDVALKSMLLLKESDTLVDHLPSSGDVVAIGLTPPDAHAIAQYLQSRNDRRVYVLFSEVAQLYDEFVEAFNATPAAVVSASRLVFATNLPHWADKNTESDTVAMFHAYNPRESTWTPLRLRGFATARLLRSIVPRMKRISPSLLVDFFYTESNIRVDDMHYGPYSDVECVKGRVTAANRCETNFGAGNISVWSMSRVLDPRVPVLSRGVTPSLEYAVMDGSSLSPSQLAGIIVGSVFFVALAIALCVLLCLFVFNSRDNNRAPREPTDPVTLIFTDIESSTAQWSTHPELMPDAVLAHHTMIRSLIMQYGCYEVKTVGDSFMIACRSTSTAVELASDIQRSFLQHCWGTTVFDDFYRNSEMQKAEDDDHYIPPSARLDPEVYRQLWNGLRVRIGIHTGLCDIRHDEVTKGYDYYGRTPNMAARTESVTNGGQVLLTYAAYMSLSTEERDQLDATSLGPVALRGVPEPIVMYQLNAVPGRAFAGLRLDRDFSFEESEDPTSTSASEHSSTHMELSGSAQTISDALHSLLSTFKAPQRERLLVPYCERWNVSLPRRKGRVWDDAYCEEVIRRIAVKVGHIAEHGARGMSASSGVTTQSGSSLIIISCNPYLSDASPKQCSRVPVSSGREVNNGMTENDAN